MDSHHPAPDPFLRPAPVLAGVGTFLLIAAAVSFVSARWDRFGPGDRFLALLVFSAVVFGIAAGLRKIAPATARSLDVLIAALVPVDVAALAIVSGASWPTVLLAAGPAAVAAAEALRRRDPSVVTEVGTVAGGVMALCGVAAHYDLALTPLVAGLGLLGCVFAPWSRDRFAGPIWALLAGLSPALRVLDGVAFTGDGTMRRLGLLDATPWQATLLAGAVATAALAYATYARRSLTAGVGSVAVSIATAAAMWAEHRPPRSLLLVAAAIVVALAEMALTHRSSTATPRLREGIAGATATANGALSFLLAAFALSVVFPEAEELGPEWVYIAAALAFAWAVADVRRMSEAGLTSVEGGRWAPATWGVAATLSSGALLLAGTATAGVVLLGLGAYVLSSRRAGRLSLAWTAGVAAPLVLVDDWPVAVAGAAVGVLLISVAAVVAHREHDRVLGSQAVLGTVAPVFVAAAVVAPHSVAGAGTVMLGLLWLAATVVDVRMPNVALALRAFGLIAATAVAGGDGGVVALVVLVSAVLWFAHRAATRQPSSVLLGTWSLIVGISLWVTDVAHEPMVVFALVAAGAGLGIAGWGLDNRVDGAQTFGGFVVWWASLIGLVGAEIGSLEPYAYPVILGLAWALHKDASTSRASWVATGVPAVLAATVAFGQRVEGGAAGHAVVFGIVALVVCTLGALRRDQPALVIGAAATVSVGAFEALDQVVGIESWSWLVVSGAAALTVAATLELTDSGLVNVDSEPAR